MDLPILRLRLVSPQRNLNEIQNINKRCVSILYLSLSPRSNYYFAMTECHFNFTKKLDFISEEIFGYHYQAIAKPKPLHTGNILLAIAFSISDFANQYIVMHKSKIYLDKCNCSMCNPSGQYFVLPLKCVLELFYSLLHTLQPQTFVNVLSPQVIFG